MQYLFDTVWPEGMDADKVMEHTPILGAELDAYLNQQYTENSVVGGVMALDNQGHILDVRVYVHGSLRENLTTPHGDGSVADADMLEWLAATPEASQTMTFIRRPHDLPWVSRPLPPESELFETSRRRAEHEGRKYIGHIITNGSNHGMMVNEVLDEDNLTDRAHIIEDATNAFGRLPDHIKAQITRLSGRRLNEMMPDVYTDDVQRAIEAAQRFYETGERPDDETADAVDRALRLLEAKLAEMDAEEASGNPRPKNPMDVPDINPRPNVPPAFYN